MDRLQVLENRVQFLERELEKRQSVSRNAWTYLKKTIQKEIPSYVGWYEVQDHAAAIVKAKFNLRNIQNLKYEQLDESLQIFREFMDLFLKHADESLKNKPVPWWKTREQE